MAFGPGKYGARAEALLREVNAELVIVITLAGRAGDAFDVATSNPILLRRLPALLRGVAEQIEHDINKGNSNAH